MLTAPLRERFGIVHHLDYYAASPSSNASYAARRACSDVPIDCRRGEHRSPRAAAERRESPTGCCGACATSPKCAPTVASPRAVADEALRREGVDELGLDRLDRAFSADHRRTVPRRTGRHRRDRGDAHRGCRDARRRRRALSAQGGLRYAHRQRPARDGARLRASRRAWRRRCARAGAVTLTRRAHFLWLGALPLAAAGARCRTESRPIRRPRRNARRCECSSARARQRDAPTTPSSLTARSYRGTFQRLDDGRIVNVVDLESYLYSVVPGRDVAALARRRRCRRRRSARARTCCSAATRGAPTTWCRRSSTKSTRGMAGEAPAAVAAVDATAGRVLKFGAGIRASGLLVVLRRTHGIVVRRVGRLAVPYLGGVVCTWCTGSPNYRWTATLSNSMRLRRIFRCRSRPLGELQICASPPTIAAAARALSSSSPTAEARPSGRARFGLRSARACCAACWSTTLRARPRRRRAARRRAAASGTASGSASGVRAAWRKRRRCERDTRARTFPERSSAITTDERLTAAYDYDLPQALIAQHPAAERDASRLMVLEGDATQHRRVRRSSGVLETRRPAGAQRDARRSRAPARAPRRRRRRRAALAASGGLDALRPVGAVRWIALTRPARRLRRGDRVSFEPWARPSSSRSSTTACAKSSFACAFRSKNSWSAAAQHAAAAIHSQRISPKRKNAIRPFLLALPEASPHRPPRCTSRPSCSSAWQTAASRSCASRSTSGSARFARSPPNPSNEHVMHAEAYAIASAAASAIERARAAPARRIVAAGTTVVRALEGNLLTFGRIEAGEHADRLFHYAGFRVRRRRVR